MSKHRILVCGGRKYNDLVTFQNVMTYLQKWFAPDFCLIHGGASGADRMAHVWAFLVGCPVIEMKANWDHYGKAAGGIRNGWMLKYASPDLIIAFPGGPGTADMVRRAKKEGIDVYEVKLGTL